MHVQLQISLTVFCQTEIHKKAHSLHSAPRTTIFNSFMTGPTTHPHDFSCSSLILFFQHFLGNFINRTTVVAGNFNRIRIIFYNIVKLSLPQSLN